MSKKSRKPNWSSSSTVPISYAVEVPLIITEDIIDEKGILPDKMGSLFRLATMQRSSDAVGKSPKITQKGKRLSRTADEPLILANLPVDILLAVCRLLPLPSLAQLSATSRFYRYLISCDTTLFNSLKSRILTGVHVFLSATLSPYVNPIFEQLLLDLLTKFPRLVIQAEVRGVPSSAYGQATLDYTIALNERVFDLQSIIPQTNRARRYESSRLFDFVQEIYEDMISDGSPSFISYTVDDDESRSLVGDVIFEEIEKQNWYFDEDRGQVERRLLREGINTFLIRGSSVRGAYVLSYRTRSGIYHALVQRWHRFYFSGELFDCSVDPKETVFSPKGVFFARMSALVWFWRELGLSRKWTLLTHK